MTTASINKITDSLMPLAIDIDSVKEDPKNARKHDSANITAIKQSLSTYGQRKPIVVNSETGIIEAGNGLWKAAKTLGWSQIAVVKVKDDPQSATGFAIMDNQSALLAEWDTPVLKELLYALEKSDFDMGATGFKDKDLEELLADLRPSQTGAIDDDAVPENAAAVCEYGDLWQLGEHRLLCGDSTDVENYKKLMGGAKCQMVFTDPPYGVAYGSPNGGDWAKRHKPIANDSLSEDEMLKFWTSVFTLVAGVVDGDVYVCGPSGPLNAFLAQAMTLSGFQQRQSLVWVKNNFVLGRGHYHYRHENIWYGWMEKSSWNGSKDQSSVWEVPRPLVSKEHPTMKPVALIEKALCNSSVRDDIVLDAFGGSGSTLIGCEKMGRKCYMLELDAHYCDVIINRWEKYSGRKAEKIECGKKAKINEGTTGSDMPAN